MATTAQPEHPQRLKMVIGFATAGRAALLGETLDELAQQTRAPDLVFICPASPADAPPEPVLSRQPYPVRLVEGPRGLCAQRNRILDAAADFDLVVFFDDDFFPKPDYLENLEAVALRHPRAVVITGQVLADGATGPGVQPAEAREILRSDRLVYGEGERRVYNGYGCNMTMRIAPIQASHLRFDEALPLYGWLEDVDFSRRLVIASDGEALWSPECRGVHLGVKSGRVSGVRFGYSQIANPLHIHAKGAISTQWMLTQMGRNLAANAAKFMKPEPWVDRRGRVKGNLMAFRDMLGGRLKPENILALD